MSTRTPGPNPGAGVDIGTEMAPACQACLGLCKVIFVSQEDEK